MAAGKARGQVEPPGLIDLGHMVIFVALNQHTNDIDHGGEGVGFVFAHLVNQTIE